MAELPRLRKAVIAVRDLEAVAGRLRAKLGLDAPLSDPRVEQFGLRGAVFTLQDTLLEVVSPIRPDADAARLLERRGDGGYMLTFEVDDLDAAVRRSQAAGVRPSFDGSKNGLAEIHLHPAEMRGAIVGLSQAHGAEPAGDDGKRAPYRLAGATIIVSQPVTVADRWQTVLGTELYNVGIRVGADELERGLRELILVADDPDDVPEQREPLVIGGVRFVFETKETAAERRQTSVFE